MEPITAKSGALRALAGMALMSCAFTSCTATPGGPQNTYTWHEGDAQMDEQEPNRELAAGLKLVNVRSERRDGRLVVNFELRSERTATLHIEWMAEWLDSSNILIDMPKHWEPITIGPMGSYSATITGPTPQANTWRLALRPKNEVH